MQASLPYWNPEKQTVTRGGAAFPADGTGRGIDSRITKAFHQRLTGLSGCCEKD
jgi:hypothetical protein